MMVLELKVMVFASAHDPRYTYPTCELSAFKFITSLGTYSNTIASHTHNSGGSPPLDHSKEVMSQQELLMSRDTMYCLLVSVLKMMGMFQLNVKFSCFVPPAMLFLLIRTHKNLT